MRLSIVLLIFEILFNGFAALIIRFNIDDMLGIGANTGRKPPELNSAVNASKDIQTGQAIGSTLLGFYNALLNTVEGIVVGLQPGVQLVLNILPGGMASALVVWMAAILPIIIAIDILAYARGVDL